MPPVTSQISFSLDIKPRHFRSSVAFQVSFGLGNQTIEEKNIYHDCYTKFTFCLEQFLEKYFTVCSGMLV